MQNNWNFYKEVRPFERIVKWSVAICLIVIVGFLLIGCVKQPIKETMQCIDGSLYSVTQQKVQLLLRDSCDKGKIEMKTSE